MLSPSKSLSYNCHLCLILAFTSASINSELERCDPSPSCFSLGLLANTNLCLFHRVANIFWTHRYRYERRVASNGSTVPSVMRRRRIISWWKRLRWPLHARNVRKHSERTCWIMRRATSIARIATTIMWVDSNDGSEHRFVEKQCWLWWPQSGDWCQDTSGCRWCGGRRCTDWLMVLYIVILDLHSMWKETWLTFTAISSKSPAQYLCDCGALFRSGASAGPSLYVIMLVYSRSVPRIEGKTELSWCLHTYINISRLWVPVIRYQCCIEPSCFMILPTLRVLSENMPEMSTVSWSNEGARICPVGGQDERRGHPHQQIHKNLPEHHRFCNIPTIVHSLSQHPRSLQKVPVLQGSSPEHHRSPRMLQFHRNN